LAATAWNVRGLRGFCHKAFVAVCQRGVEGGLDFFGGGAEVGASELKFGFFVRGEEIG
jgi:hypothetical protein